MVDIRSKIAVNRLCDFLREKDLSVRQLAEKTRLSEARIQAFVDDRHLMPDTEAVAAFMWGLAGEDPTRLLVFDPIDPQATVSEMIPNGQGPLTVVVCGGGNLGHVFAGLLGARTDVVVRVLVSSPEKAQKMKQAMGSEGIGVHLPNGAVVHGMPDMITADPGAAIPGARLILLCVPSHVEVAVLNRILPFVSGSDTYIGSVPAPGGFDWKARHLLQVHGKVATVFGMGYIPWMCKVADYGRVVRVLGHKLINALVVLPESKTEDVANMMGHLLQTPVMNLGYFLNMTLHMGNQVLHPGIMYAMFKDWDGKPLLEQPLFYEGVSQEATDVVQRLSNEILTLKGQLEMRLPGVALSFVLPLHLSILYGKAVQDASSLQSAIATNLAYAGIRTPMVQQDGGWVPDWNSRFFWEDIPHGLVVLRGLADLLAVHVPTIDAVLVWAQERMGKVYLQDGCLTGKDMAETGAPQSYGIATLDALIVQRRA